MVNMNWDEFTETFCCAAAEMLASGLPVFSVARGALPETIGHSGGAFLTKQPLPQAAAAELTSLLNDATRLSSLGRLGRQYVCSEYGWDDIVDHWINLLNHTSEIEDLAGPWRGPLSMRYFFGRSAGRLGIPWLLDAATGILRTVNGFGANADATIR